MVGSPPTHWSVRAPSSRPRSTASGEELRRQRPPAPGVKRIRLRDAEGTPQVAARQVKQVGRDQLPLLAIFHPVLVHPRHRSRLARPSLACHPVGPALVLAQAGKTGSAGARAPNGFELKSSSS